MFNDLELRVPNSNSRYSLKLTMAAERAQRGAARRRHRDGGGFNFPCNEPHGALFGKLLSEGRWTVPPEVRAGYDEPGSNKFRNARPGNRSWFTWSFLNFLLVSDSLLTERPSPVGWFANLGSFRTAVVSVQQVETNDQASCHPAATTLMRAAASRITGPC